MTENQSFIQQLTDDELQEIYACSTVNEYNDGETIFSEGDELDSFYIIESGAVSIVIDKSGKCEQVCVLNRGEYFGEMAMFTSSTRTATATAAGKTELRCVAKEQFLNFVNAYPHIEEKINVVLGKRNEELSLKENLMIATGLDAKKLYISIKGDPSLRESAIIRERYESIVDKYLPDLQRCLQELLLNRCIYRVFMNMNSGEIRTCSIFNPFYEEIHTANKLISASYIDRHFPVIAYQEKVKYIRRMFHFTVEDELFKTVPNQFKNIFSKMYAGCEPVTREEISRVISKFNSLRSIESFYLRNISISIIQDAIRMQFNCDGTHIVSSEKYQQFLSDNLSE